MAATLAEPGHRPHGDVVHTGPVVSGVPAAPSRPTVLVSLSTFGSRACEPTLAAASSTRLAPLEPASIVTTGPAVDAGRLRGAVPTSRCTLAPPRRGDARGVAWWWATAATPPPCARWPTTCRSWCIPMDPMIDQPFVGKAVERAGRRTDDGAQGPQRATIRAAVEELLADGPAPRGGRPARRGGARPARRRQLAPTGSEAPAQPRRSCGARSPARLDRDVGQGRARRPARAAPPRAPRRCPRGRRPRPTPPSRPAGRPCGRP